MTSLLGQSGTSHTNSITALAFSSEGTTVVSAARDGTIRIWDIDTQKQIRVIPLEPPAYIEKLLVLPDSSSIAFTSANTELMTWSESVGIKRLIGDQEVRNIILCPSGHFFVERARHSLYWGQLANGSSSERYFGDYPRLAGAASTTNGSFVALWVGHRLMYMDTHSGKCCWEIELPQTSAPLFFNSDESHLILGPLFGCLYKIEVSTGYCSRIPLSPPPTHSHALLGLSDGVLITGGGDNNTCIWDAHSHELLSSLSDGSTKKFYSQTAMTVDTTKTHDGSTTALAVSPNQSLLATGGDDHLVKIWDIRSQRMIGRLGRKQNQVRALVFTDSNHVVAGYEDGWIRLSSVDDSRVIASQEAHSLSISAIFRQQSRLISMDDSGTVHIWRYPSFEFEAEIKVADEFFISALAAARDVPILLLIGRNPERQYHPDSLIFWDADSNQEIARWDVSNIVTSQDERKQSFLSTISISADGSLVAAGNGDDVWIWDFSSARIRGHHQTGSTCHNSRSVSRVMYSDDGSLLAVGTFGHHIHLLNSSNAQICEVLTDLESTSTLCFSPDNRLCVTATHYDNRIIVHTLHSETFGKPLLGHTGPVQCVDFSPDGSMFASGGRDGVIVIWKENQIVNSFSLGDSQR